MLEGKWYELSSHEMDWHKMLFLGDPLPCPVGRELYRGRPDADAWLSRERGAAGFAMVQPVLDESYAANRCRWLQTVHRQHRGRKSGRDAFRDAIVSCGVCACIAAVQSRRWRVELSCLHDQLYDRCWDGDLVFAAVPAVLQLFWVGIS